MDFLITGYIQTGSKDVFYEGNSITAATTVTEPKYDEGTQLGKASIVFKQTPENISNAKKIIRKMKIGF